MEKMSNSKREDKLEALDFVLSVLEKDVKDLGRIVKDLEKVSESFDKLDELASRLGAVETLLATYASKIPPSAPSPTAAPAAPAAPARTSGPPYTVTFRIWEEFKAAAEDAELITFGIAKEDTLEISAQKEGRLCRYQGKLPRGGRIIKSWLARELGIQEARIVEGELSHSK